MQLILWICLVAAGQGILIGIVILRGRQSQPAGRLLGWLITGFALAMASFVLNMTIRSTTWYPGPVLTWAIAAFFGPLLLMFVRGITGFSFRLPFHYWHFIPALFYIAEVLMYWIGGKQMILLTNLQMALPANFILLGYVITALLHLKYYTGKVVQFNPQQNNALVNTRKLLIFFGLYAFSLLAFLICVIVKSTAGIYITILIKVLLTLAIYYLSYAKLRIGYQLAVREDVLPKEKYKTTTLSIETADYILKRLKRVMQEEKLFLSPSLKLKEVADKLGTSTHHLSRVINERLALSFPDYINCCRVEAAQQLLLSDHTITIEAIGQRSGFRNKTSFNNAFRKFTQQTPSQFRAAGGQQASHADQ
ncbi:AraC family transcriptional regulator [Pseudoflavitalea sp. G-6-1-2]|uniref:AraC family transcriptional regulator n=1 Tax=Pseudoflavitalea sp. G-6-1-2 TaxID=2728841 RepID=UPI00146DECE1|nr:helix-turn-helix domain-containing protein [Pseudoflavitalea sp. G-6-1-2]NML22715.1 AraC family transcriptional regulator [Pseudoflavitalea sp. G-6-1-2]